MIRTAWTLCSLILFCSTRTHADDCRPPDPHIRSTDHEIVAAIADAALYEVLPMMSGDITEEQFALELDTAMRRIGSAPAAPRSPRRV